MNLTRALGVISISLLFFSTLVMAEEKSESWKDFQKQVESKKVKISERLPKKEIEVNYQSTNRIEGRCRSTESVATEKVMTGEFDIHAACDGKGWEKKQPGFNTLKKITIGSLDHYPAKNPKSESLSIEKSHQFVKSGAIQFEIDESDHFGLRLKQVNGRWEIYQLNYASDDPG